MFLQEHFWKKMLVTECAGKNHILKLFPLTSMVLSHLQIKFCF